VLQENCQPAENTQNRIHCYSLKTCDCPTAPSLFISREEFVIKGRNIYIYIFQLRETFLEVKHISSAYVFCSSCLIPEVNNRLPFSVDCKILDINLPD
jgi:hypothetical protein